ncbi:MAG: hypothetical protein ACHQ50_12405 [Fimbriimonadales bacterium]
MWSARLVQSLRKLGHEPLLRSKMPDDPEGAKAAIVNLGDQGLDAKTLVARLHDLGVPVIAHAGHKERDLHELGLEAKAEILASNSQITFKLAELLSSIHR